MRYGFGTIPGSDAVFQWRSVHASFYTPMDLRAFPFDTQQLLIQVQFRLILLASCLGCRFPVVQRSRHFSHPHGSGFIFLPCFLTHSSCLHRWGLGLRVDGRV